MIDIEIMQDASEIINYDSVEIPYAIQERKLSSYTNMRALCHWHDDLEFISVLDGEMLYDVNGEKILLKKGDHILVNSQQLHFGCHHNHSECDFTCIIFHPNLLKSNIFMYENYVLPIISSSNIEYMYFPCGSDQCKNLSDIQTALQNLVKHPKSAFEYQIVGQFFLLWSVVYESCDKDLLSTSESEKSDIILQKKMVSYIYQHYMDNISLDEIAESANISRSKCCKIFRNYLQDTPVSFLNSYRLEISKNLLKNTNYNITQIATACGYTHLSYFSQLFQKKYGQTPNEYRKSID